MGGVGRTLLAPLVALLLVLSMLVGAHAVGIGVNRALINYADVLQNGYAQESVTITTDSPDEITGTYEIEGELTIIVEPPADARLQTYSGGVRILTGEVTRGGGGKIGTSTRAAFFIRVSAGITGTQVLRCSFGGVELKSTEVGQSVDFLASVHNAGNVRVRPQFTIEVYDQYQTKLLANLTESADNDTLPTTPVQFLRQLGMKLPEGQYWAVVQSPLCEGSAFTTFDVLERGGISDKG